MAKIPRKLQKLFGSTAGVNQVAKFGSLANGTPVRYDGTADPDNIQALSQFLAGWSNAVIGGNAPCKEDLNALCFLFAYQIAYNFQAGVAEWLATTTYYIGSLVNDGSGNIYISLTDTNLGNALTDGTKWQLFRQDVASVITAAASTTTLTNASPRRIDVIGATTQSIVLPSAATLTVGWQFEIANYSTGLVTVYANDGTTVLAILAASGTDGSWAFFDLTA